MGLTKEILRVRGMQCSNCESIVENSLRLLQGVRSAKADYGSETVTVTYDDRRCNAYQMAKALELKGYECFQMTGRPHTWRDGLRKLLRIVLGLTGIVAIFFAGTQIPGLNAMPGLGRQASVGLLFLAGLLTSFHCVAMCGGFVVGYSTQDAISGKPSYALAHLAYGLGKTLSYAGIGALFGLAGALVAITPAMKGAAALLAGIFLLGFGLNMLHLMPHLRWFSLPMPRWLSRFVHSGFRKHHNPFVIGLLNGLMIACGPLQAMYVMAAGTGSPVEGARILLFFGLGTLPLMLGFGFMASLISHNASQKILKASGVIVLALGLIMFNRGLVLTGSGYDFTTLSLRISQEARGLGQSLAHMARLHGDYQTIRTVVGREGFEPSTFMLRRGVHVHWIIDVKELTECNRVIVVPKLGLSIELKLGEQTVEFTPGQSGLILWSCWMGMLRGEFQVVDGDPPQPNAD